MTESQSNIINQASFKETPYNDAAWEVVGEPPTEQNFTPMELAVINTGAVNSDPMFADLGGHRETESTKRWHLPKELAVKHQNEEFKDAPDIAQPTGITLQEEELANLKQQAFEQGKAQGLAEAKTAHDQMLKTLASRVEGLVQDLNQQISENLDGVEKSAVKLALDISGKLVGHAVEINPEYITKIVQEAIKSAGGAVIQRVRISPEDMEFIQVVGLADKLRESDANWSFEKDESVKSGCVVDSSAGEIDFQLDKAWERICDSVMKSIR